MVSEVCMSPNGDNRGVKESGLAVWILDTVASPAGPDFSHSRLSRCLYVLRRFGQLSGTRVLFSLQLSRNHSLNRL